MNDNSNVIIAPDLDDMMASGMGLTEAVAYWNHMMRHPDVPTQYWWDELSKLRKAKTQ